jgi:hypothetical protein
MLCTKIHVFIWSTNIELDGKESVRFTETLQFPIKKTIPYR